MESLEKEIEEARIWTSLQKIEELGLDYPSEDVVSEETFNLSVEFLEYVFKFTNKVGLWSAGNNSMDIHIQDSNLNGLINFEKSSVGLFLGGHGDNKRIQYSSNYSNQNWKNELKEIIEFAYFNSFGKGSE